MPAHKRAIRITTEARDVIEACLSEGYFPPDMSVPGRGAHTEAAKRLAERYGVAESTAWNWIKATEDLDYPPDYSLFRPIQYQAHSDLKAHRTSSIMRPLSPVRIGLIGDAHDGPALPDKERFRWMGAWVADEGFDEVWQIGDFVTLDSLTRHSIPGSKSFGDLPSFRDDLLSIREALDAFDEGLNGFDVNKVITLGNHEDRASRYEELNPQMSGTVTAALHKEFSDHGWRIIPYGEIAFLEGVGLTHCAISMTGRPYGGKTADQRTGSDTTFSLIHGHTHARTMVPSPKIGPMGRVDVMSIGCSLPHGYIEEYAKHGPSGWWWGVVSAELSQGQILGANYTSMLNLEDRYG